MKALGYIKWLAKAIVAGATAAGGTLTLALADASAGGSSIVGSEYATIGIATAIGFFGVFAATNGDKPG